MCMRGGCDEPIVEMVWSPRTALKVRAAILSVSLTHDSNNSITASARAFHSLLFIPIVTSKC